MKKTKPKVEINAGALVIVIVNGAQKKFSCSSTTRPGTSPEKVIKQLQDCVRSSIAKATKTK